MENGIIETWEEFKCLAVTITQDKIRQKDVLNKLAQGRRSVQLIYSALWSKKMKEKIKIAIYKAITQSISTYGSNKKQNID